MKSGTIAHQSDGFKAFMQRNRKLFDNIQQTGGFAGWIQRKSGLLEPLAFPNASTTQGKNYLLDAAFRNTGTTANWYLGLIDLEDFSAVDAADTAASHGGWVEFETYTESTRQAWVKSAASGGIMNASAAAQFTIGAVSAGAYLKGAFVASASARGATTGFLWATGTFPANIPIQEDDILNLTYFTQLT